MKYLIPKILIGTILFLQCNPTNKDNTEELGIIALLLMNAQKYGRYGHVSVSVGNDILIIGGQNGYKTYNEIFEFDPIQNLIFQVNSMKFARSNFKAVRLLDGRVFIVGGDPSPLSAASNAAPQLNQTEIYDPITNSIISGPSLIQGRSDFSMDLLNDGRVLIAGGKANSALKSAELFDPNSLTLIPVGNLNFNRCLHTSTKLNNGKILMIGGLDNSQITVATSELFDPSTLTFTSSGNLSVSRTLHTSNLLANGNVLVTGGYRVTTPPFASNTKVVELYDSTLNTFSYVGNLSEFKVSHTATSTASNRILLCGGNQILSGSPILSSCELYDTGSISVVGSGQMQSKRSSHIANIVNGSKVLIASGFDRVDSSSGIPLSNKTSELFDFNQFTSASVFGDL
ncbi:Kelch repeat-containing protein [Leptospira kmetyi]|uniref:Galactose oxidase n=1 Tax=Leptospira kmetyi TaxID=408139 RepID=A0ABX4N3Y4_9LEPT|nr:kelch repeat-containing protein [Leptospira kmetyi]PJZ27880.1 galactose oxidase [Leptospira kmetyi]PJZ39770.1 galactose oxidase [Leptospira kmetyi]